MKTSAVFSSRPAACHQESRSFLSKSLEAEAEAAVEASLMMSYSNNSIGDLSSHSPHSASESPTLEQEQQQQQNQPRDGSNSSRNTPVSVMSAGDVGEGESAATGGATASTSAMFPTSPSEDEQFEADKRTIKR